MTQEERIAALEQNFGKFQREVELSISDLNANGTILLGLVQYLVQESKQTKFRLETMHLRMDILESKVDDHTRMLQDHTKVLNEHTRILNDHTARFDRLEALIGQVLERLPKTS